MYIGQETEIDMKNEAGLEASIFKAYIKLYRSSTISITLMNMLTGEKTSLIIRDGKIVNDEIEKNPLAT